MRGGYATLTFISRFVLTPVASPVSLLAGVSHMRAGLYLALEVLGEGIFVLGTLTLGRVFGARLLEQSATLPLFGLLIAAAILLPIALVRLATHLLARKRNATPAPRSTPEEAGAQPGTSRA
jgi:membrane protein DedA with SNARE-associated domain